MSKDIIKLMGLKTDMVGEIHARPITEILSKEVSTLFGRDKQNFSSVPVKGGEVKKQSIPNIREETSLVPRDIPKQKESSFTFALSDYLTSGKMSEEFETSQTGHTIKNCTQDISADGTVVTRWEGVNKEKTLYKAEGRVTGNIQEIKSEGKNGEFESRSEIMKEGSAGTRETVYMKNNKSGTETSYVIERKGSLEKQEGTLKTGEGDFSSYKLEKSGGKVQQEIVRIDFSDGPIEMRETVRDIEKMIDTLSFFSEKSMEEFVGLELTEKEAIGIIAKNLREGKISTGRIKKEIFSDDGVWDEGTLLELIEQEQSLSLDSNKNPVCFRKTKIYDKEGNITGEEEEESFYRSEEDNGDRQHVIIRRTYKFINEEKIQTDEEEFIDCFPLSRQKNIQFSKTYFQYGKRIHKRTDRIQQGDIREEYKDLSTIAETGIKLLFARLLEGGSQEISIRHHGDIFYDTIETEDKEIRCTVYKSTRRPSCLLMRVDLLKGYNITLPLWVLVSASYDQVETQFLFEGVKDSTLVDRFDKTTLYHTFRGTLKNEDLKGELLREATRIQTRMDEEARDKLKSEDRSYLEFKFSDRADSLFHVLTPGWIKNNSPSGWMQKNEELSSSEIIENIIYCLIKYLHPDNKLRRESALERKHTFLPLVVSGATGLEAILGQKFGVDLVFLLWEMLNITGYADGKDKFASLKI